MEKHQRGEAPQRRSTTEEMHQRGRSTKEEKHNRGEAPQRRSTTEEKYHRGEAPKRSHGGPGLITLQSHEGPGDASQV